MDAQYQIPLLEGLPTGELEWLVAHGVERTLQLGEAFAVEGGPGDEFYIVLDGELQVTRHVTGKELVLGTTPRGIIGGEQALLNGTPSEITARALGPVRLLVLDAQAFRQVFAHCPVLGTRIFQVAAERTQSYATLLKQQEKMAALGKLAAGLAHELNNPAAAARRGAHALREALVALQGYMLTLNRLGLSADELKKLADFLAMLEERSPASLSTLEQSDREEELGDWLEAQRVPQAWESAPVFVAAGLTLDELEDLLAGVPAGARVAVLGWVRAVLDTLSLVGEIDASTRRISDLVGAIKSYTHMDQVTAQETDLQRGLDITLLILKHKLVDIHVVRQYDPDLPKILARGGELNQVWTNLIDNAVDALDGRGELHIITRCENDYAMVEITDNGPGIPPEVLPRIFEPFFTTKGVGAGTGLGLDISYRIVKEHQGTIEVRSEPGCTRFIVRLPALTPRSTTSNTHEGRV